MRVGFLSHAFPRSTDCGPDMVLARRAQELGRLAPVVAISPVPWAPPLIGRGHPRWRRYATAPRRLELGQVPVFYPRYVQLPGRWFAPLAGASMALGALPILRRLRAEGRLDVLYAQTTLPDGLAAALLGRWLDVPATCLARGSDVNVIGSSTFLGRWITRWTVSRLAAVAVVAHDLGANLARITTLPRGARVLYDGIDLGHFSPGPREVARESLGLRQDEAIVLYVGRIVVGKGLEDLIDAFAPISFEMPDARLVVVGDGNLRDSLRIQATRMGVESGVWFVGEQSYERIPIWMRAADVVALPSRAEGFPNVVREAMACGRPVVATPVGDVPRVVSRDVGRLVPVGDVTALTVALREVLEGRWDDATIRDRVSSMTWDRNAAETHEFLEAAA